MAHHPIYVAEDIAIPARTTSANGWRKANCWPRQPGRTRHPESRSATAPSFRSSAATTRWTRAPPTRGTLLEHAQCLDGQGHV